MNAKKLSVYAACAGLLVSPGCYSHRVEKETIIKEVPATTGPIVIQSETMPPLRVEEPGPAPAKGAVWVPGFWKKTDRGWVWHTGHWEVR
jgi:hypothetical protein